MIADTIRKLERSKREAEKLVTYLLQRSRKMMEAWARWGWQRRRNNGRSQWCVGIKTEQILGQLNTSHRLYIYDEIGTVRSINE